MTHLPWTTRLVAESGFNREHCIQLQDTNILSAKAQNIVWVISDMTQIELHHKNMKKRDGMFLSMSWKLLIHSLKSNSQNLSSRVHDRNIMASFRAKRSRLSFIVIFYRWLSILIHFSIFSCYAPNPSFYFHCLQLALDMT